MPKAKVLIVDDQEKRAPGPSRTMESALRTLKEKLEDADYDASIEMGRDDTHRPLARPESLAERLRMRIMEERFEALVMDIRWPSDDRFGLKTWHLLKRGGIQIHNSMLVFITEHVRLNELASLASVNDLDPKQFVFKRGDWHAQVIRWLDGQV